MILEDPWWRFYVKPLPGDYSLDYEVAVQAPTYLEAEGKLRRMMGGEHRLVCTTDGPDPSRYTVERLPVVHPTASN